MHFSVTYGKYVFAKGKGKSIPIVNLYLPSGKNLRPEKERLGIMYSKDRHA